MKRLLSKIGVNMLMNNDNFVRLKFRNPSKDPSYNDRPEM